MSQIYIAKSGAKNAPTLPPDAVTRTFGIFGSRGSGKTTTARVIVEGIAKTGGHAIVLDPVGVWWGATRAGSGAGIAGVVIGGEHADVPLEEGGGKLIAELALARQYPLIVVDMKMLRKGAQRRFLGPLLEELYFRNRLPLSVVFEEADQTLPQAPRNMDPAMGIVLGAAEDIVKLGRSRGLGAIVISQRMATVNKNVTEQTENLLLMRMAGPRDRKAAREWIEGNGDPSVTGQVLDTMASLHQGEAWLYSPGWLRLLEKLRIREARTLDSSATPTNEQAQIEQSAKRAPISLEELRTQMAATIERAKENDPAELRKRVKALERELAAKSNMTSAEPEKIVVPDAALVEQMRDMAELLAPAVEELEGIRDQVDRDLRQAHAEATAVVSTITENITQAHSALGDMRAQLERLQGVPKDGQPAQTVSRRVAAPTVGEAVETIRKTGLGTGRNLPAPESNGRVSGPQQRILDALAWFQSIEVQAPRKVPLAAMAGVSSKSSGFRANLSALRSAELIATAEQGSRVMLTTTGYEQAYHPERIGSDEELQAALMNAISGPQGAILRELIGVYPESIEREELAQRVGVSPASSGYRANLSTLRGLGLIDYPQPGYLSASDICFVSR